MAAPNIVNVTTITAKNSPLAVTTTATAIVTVAANSAVKVNSVMVTNIGTTNYTVTLDLYRSSVAYQVAYNISVPVGATVVLIGKDNMMYLEETDAMRLTASANSVLVATTSYEILA